MFSEKKTFDVGCCVTAEVSATGSMGGDDAYGGRASLYLREGGGFVWELKIVTAEGEEILVEQPRSFKITVKGDWEQDGLARALLWAGPALAKCHTAAEVTKRKMTEGDLSNDRRTIGEE